MTQQPDPVQPNPDLVTSPAAEPEPSSEPHVAVTGERIVLNTSTQPEARPLADVARDLVAVAAAAGELDRDGITERLRAVFTDTASREAAPTEVERYAESLMRASRSSLSVEDDTGAVLATYDAPGREHREQPTVSDPADEDRPFYS